MKDSINTVKTDTLRKIIEILKEEFPKITKKEFKELLSNMINIEL